jgi:hypothetical protein
MLGAMSESSNGNDIHLHHHAVQFYGSDDTLCSTVAGFLSEGLIGGHPAIVIATEGHREAIKAQLATRLIDVDKAQQRGDLVLIDAQQALDTFMEGDDPNPVLFRKHVGELIAAKLRDRPRTIVRAYGEMVDVLWQEGRTAAAIRLEILWNKLAVSHSFALLCGYSMGSFYKQAELFQEVCRQHTHSSIPDSNVAVFEAKAGRSA